MLTPRSSTRYLEVMAWKDDFPSEWGEKESCSWTELLCMQRVTCRASPVQNVLALLNIKFSLIWGLVSLTFTYFFCDLHLKIHQLLYFCPIFLFPFNFCCICWWLDCSWYIWYYRRSHGLHSIASLPFGCSESSYFCLVVLLFGSRYKLYVPH